ncbi:hypothetical protein Tco_0809333 [Tanacetum coccineum]
MLKNPANDRNYGKEQLCFRDFTRERERINPLGVPAEGEKVLKSTPSIKEMTSSFVDASSNTEPKVAGGERNLNPPKAVTGEVDLQEEPAPTGDQSGPSAPPVPKTAKQLAAKRNQERVKSILLLAIPDEYLLKFHNVPDAKSLWEAIKSRFGGNEESKKMKISSIFKSLPLHWSQIALIMRNKPDIDQTNIDDLYNNLRVYEDEMKRTISFIYPVPDEVMCFSLHNRHRSSNLKMRTCQQDCMKMDLEELDLDGSSNVGVYNCHMKGGILLWECNSRRKSREKALMVIMEEECLSKMELHPQAMVAQDEPLNDTYETPKHTQKVFANMRSKGKSFSGRVTPLFAYMLVPQVVEGEGLGQPSEPQSPPSTAPSSQKGQKIGSSDRPRCQEAIGGVIAHTRSERASKYSYDSPLPGVNTPGSDEERIEHQELTDNIPPTPHDLPLSGGYTPGSDEGRPDLHELMDICRNQVITSLHTLLHGLNKRERN